VRGQSDDLPEAGDGFFVAPQRVQREAEVLVGVRQPRLRGNRALQVGQGFLGPVERAQHAARVVAGLRVAGIEARRSEERGEGLFVLPLAHERHAERVMGVRVIRVGLRLALQRLLRAREIPKSEMAIPQPVGDAAALELVERGAQRAERLPGAAFEQQRAAEEVERLGVGRRACERIARRLLCDAVLVALERVPRCLHVAGDSRIPCA